MKQKTLNKRLVINKVTVANLNNKELAAIRGGSNDTVHGRTCEGTVLGPTCDGELEVEAAAAGTVLEATCEGTVLGPTCDGQS